MEDPDNFENLKEILNQRKSNQNKLHVDEVKKGGLEIKIGLPKCHLTNLEDYSKRNQFLGSSEITKSKIRDFMAFRLTLTYNEIEKILDYKLIGAENRNFSISTWSV